METYCNKCSREIRGASANPEINVYSIVSELPRGCFKSVECDGCELIGVNILIDGQVFLVFNQDTGKGYEHISVSLKTWEDTSQFTHGTENKIEYCGGVQVGSQSSDYRIKILQGPYSNPQKYHVIQEHADTDKTVYSYLTAHEVRERHSIDLTDPFKWIETQNVFKP